MSQKNTADRYGAASITLHWLMLLLIAAVYLCIELRENYPKGSEIREALKVWHYCLGLSVLVLVWLRIGVRAFGPQPETRSETASWMRLSAKGVHFALYLLMVGQPLLGWLTLSAGGHSVLLFGFPLPLLIAKQSNTFADSIKEIHEIVGVLGYGLIALHAFAALFHHYIKRDNTLKRMLPRGWLVKEEG
jgi:cytochrome b561